MWNNLSNSIFFKRLMSVDAKEQMGCMVLLGMFLVLGVLGARIVKNYISIGSFLTIEFILKERVVIVAGAELLLGILFLCFDRYSYAVIIMVSNLFRYLICDWCAA